LYFFDFLIFLIIDFLIFLIIDFLIFDFFYY